MSAICIFGALCSVNNGLFVSSRYPLGPAVSSGLDLIAQNSNQQYSSDSKNPTNTHVERPNHQSPCPSVFRYIQESGEWKGEVTLENIDSQRDTNLRVEITINKILSDKNVGTIQLATSIEESTNDILNNRPLKYRVIFPSQNPVPKVKGIYYNNKLVCSGPGDTGHPVTTIKLSNILKAGQYNIRTTIRPNYQPDYQQEYQPEYQQEYQPQPPAYQQQPPQYQTQPPAYQTQPSAYQTKPPAYQTNRPTALYQTQPPEYQPPSPAYQTKPQAYHTKRPTTQQQINYNKFSTKPTAQQNYNESSAGETVCGTPVLGLTQSLVVGGKEVARGQWPWLVAFYKAGRGNLEFICGGNLISKSHVVTAAHCIQDKQSNKKREAETGVVYVGKHNLDNWNEQGSQKKGVQRFIVNNEWKPFDIIYDADIAIIVTDSPVEYSQYVRPLCVWEFPDDLNDVVGQRGVVAGWGLNENFVLNSEYPKMIEVPIVSEGTCLRSHPAILAISSDRTFCAGGKNGEGPCGGDSGGGLILYRGNKWYLRGLVSSSPRDGTNPCDPKSFAVFTDVAKFSSWIRSNT